MASAFSEKKIPVVKSDHDVLRNNISVNVKILFAFNKKYCHLDFFGKLKADRKVFPITFEYK